MLRYVTLDATGTLLRLRERIGAVYVAHWQRVASASSPASAALELPQREALERAVDATFPMAFRAHTQRFPNFGRSVLSSQTAAPWWSRVILASLPGELVQVLSVDAQRELTTSLYAYYASAAAWRVFDEVPATLRALETKGVRMAVISDFDERLPRILEELELAPFFETITTSWVFGEPKPSPAIFRHTFEVLQKMDGKKVDPSEFLHVGDHLARDYEGARAVGAHARLLDRRDSVKIHAADVQLLKTLDGVLPLLQ